MAENIALDKIETNVAFARLFIDTGVVEGYREAMIAGDVFPPIVVFRCGSRVFLADGHHRVEAAKAAGLTEIQADVRGGDIRDAKWFAASANAEHGHRRSYGDRRAAVRLLLTDEEWSKWADAEIARQCRVSDHLVAAVRAELSRELSSKSRRPSKLPSKRRRFKTRYGAIKEMNTGNIGKRPKPPPLQPEQPDEAPPPDERFRNSVAYHAGDSIALRAYLDREFGDWRRFDLPSDLKTLVKQAAEAWQQLADDMLIDLPAKAGRKT